MIVYQWTGAQELDFSSEAAHLEVRRITVSGNTIRADGIFMGRICHKPFTALWRAKNIRNSGWDIKRKHDDTLWHESIARVIKSFIARQLEDFMEIERGEKPYFKFPICRHMKKSCPANPLLRENIARSGKFFPEKCFLCDLQKE